MISFLVTLVIVYFITGFILAVYFGWPRGEVPVWRIRILTGLLIMATWPQTLWEFIRMFLMPSKDLEALLKEYEAKAKKYREIEKERKKENARMENS